MNNRELPIDGEKNLIDLARKHGIFIPNFCYHPDLSRFGACRLCLVEIEKMGIQAACCTAPRPGMVVKTNTEEIRSIRKTALELLLANHRVECPTCEKNGNCELMDLSKKLNVTENNYYKSNQEPKIDESSYSLVRDSSKCILCGQCVRACSEIQGIGVLDFAFRGSKSMVLPAFGKNLLDVECVNCGNCAKVCPTGAITIKNETEKAFKAIDSDKVVIANIAPAVRVAINEMFGLPASEDTTGKLVTALKAVGFDYVFDTCYGADITVLEEGAEFIKRKTQGGVLPQFTSCCPAWVKYLEEFYPELIPNLSSAKSPQQMFGALIKEYFPKQIGKTKEDIYNVSIMPCTAKKYEITQEKFGQECPDYDLVLTTVEIGNMIKGAGIDFASLEPSECDKPFGMKSGGGVIFGVTGGVTEAVLRFAAEEITGEKLKDVNFVAVRGMEGIREANLEVGGVKLKIALVHTLSNAKQLCESIKAGKCDYDLIEVMTCKGGCINGGGQPRNFDPDFKEKRAKDIYQADEDQAIRSSQDNTDLKKLYAEVLGQIGSEIPHHLFHTDYSEKKIW